MGLEPTISRTTIWRANQLHHTHHITVLGGIRTPDPRLRRPLLYPTELQTHIAFIGVLKLSSSALRKRVMGIEPTYLAWKASVLPLNYTRKIGVTGFEPATSWSQTRRSSQAEPHPVFCFRCCHLRDTIVIIYALHGNVNNFFQFFLFFFIFLKNAHFTAFL